MRAEGKIDGLKRTVIEAAGASFSKPFFWILVFRQAVMFLAFGLGVPRYKLAPTGLLPCTISVSNEFFVISDLSRPHRGLVSISRPDMRSVLDRMIAAAEERFGRFRADSAQTPDHPAPSVAPSDRRAQTG